LKRPSRTSPSPASSSRSREDANKFYKKHQALLKTTGRLLGGYPIFAAPEAIAALLPRGPRWREESEGSTMRMVFVPVDGCEMKAPQPFAIQLPLQGLKIALTTMVLGFVPRNIRVPSSVGGRNVTWWEQALYVGAVTYSTLVVPASMFLLIRHYFDIYGNLSGGAAYECFFCGLELGPL